MLPVAVFGRSMEATHVKTDGRGVAHRSGHIGRDGAGERKARLPAAARLARRRTAAFWTSEVLVRRKISCIDERRWLAWRGGWDCGKPQSLARATRHARARGRGGETLTATHSHRRHPRTARRLDRRSGSGDAA